MHNSAFFFSYTGYQTKAKKPNMSNQLPIAGGGKKKWINDKGICAK